MNDSFDPAWGIDTLGIRASELRSEFGEHSPGIFATSSFCFGSAEAAAETFADQRSGYIYSRFTNPTVAAFEQRLAAMEGGESCVATASGMAAILSLCLAVLKQGDHVIASRTLFGTTISLFNNYLAKFGVSFSYVDPCRLDEWREAMTPATRLLFVETPTNPLGEIVDIRALADLAQSGGALLAVDNCFLTPALQRPLSLGADVVVHSATKYLDGQGRCVGGAVVGDESRIGKPLFAFLRTCGPSLSPFNAWVFLKGLETLGLRMRAHDASAGQLAEWLAQRPEVERVHYAGLPDHPQHHLARAQQRGFGGIVSFDLKGGQAQAFRFINALRLVSITANLGDTRSTVTHPATTTHMRIGPELRRAAGIGDGLVRLSVGLEDTQDLLSDLDNALQHI